MGLESATYISDLNTANPVHASDNVSEGDDHIRLIKSTLKNSFPFIDGAVSATDTELNYCSGVTSAIQTQITSLGNQRLRLPATITTFNTNQSASVNNSYFQTGGSSLTVTLPTTTTFGDSVWVYANASGTTIGRAGGEKINGTAADAVSTGAQWMIFIWSGNSGSIGWMRIA